MAHLVDREGSLDEDEIGALWDYLRGNGPPVHTDLRRPNHCVECRGYLISDTERGCDVCAECGVVQPDSQHFVDTFDDRDRATQRPREGYKPIHHWHERLAQYHLQESPICHKDWARICQALHARGDDRLDKERLRTLLRSLRLERYNENWLQILQRLTGYTPPPLDGEELELLDTLFIAVHEPFRLFKGTGRKNLPNYNFLLARLLQHIGRPELCKHFPQLKTRAKWLEIDRVWARVCEYHDWPHLPEPCFEPLVVPLEQRRVELQARFYAALAKLPT